MPFTVGTAIGDLANKDQNQAHNHVPLKHGEINIRRYQLIPEGGRLPENDLPPELYRKNFGNTFKRLHRNKPSLTNRRFFVKRFLNNRQRDFFPYMLLFCASYYNFTYLIGVFALRYELVAIFGQTFNDKSAFGVGEIQMIFYLSHSRHRVGCFERLTPVLYAFRDFYKLLTCNIASSAYAHRNAFTLF